LQKEVAKAIKNGEILYYVQFVVDIKNNRVSAAEAISRWQHPRDGLLMPGEYITLMKQAHTISQLDYYMFERTCKQVEKWKNTENEELVISCNIDRMTISNSDFYDRIIEISSAYDIDRSKIILEITEDTLKYNTEIAVRNAVRVREAGFGLALDDFGSGYTSFQNILEFPINRIKMDRSFVNIIDSDNGKEVIKGIIDISHKLGIDVIFEGIETQRYCDMVSDLGVDDVQGFYFSRVIPITEAAYVLEKLRKRLRGDTVQETIPVFEDVEEAAIFGENVKLFGRVGYGKSFEVKLSRATAQIAEYYSKVKAELENYKYVKSHLSLVYESVSIGKVSLAKLVMTSKSLLICLALDPGEHSVDKYGFKDVSYSKKYQKVPMCVKVYDERTFKIAMKLIEILAEKHYLTRK
jgi:EAL domain-containing protein (putative c-di-GMP-specific phosphodiesterase class I)